MSLHNRDRLAGRSRADRRAFLKQWAARVIVRMARRGVVARSETLSVSGQTLEALVPISAYDDVAEELALLGVRLDILEDRDATLSP